MSNNIDFNSISTITLVVINLYSKTNGNIHLKVREISKTW